MTNSFIQNNESDMAEEKYSTIRFPTTDLQQLTGPEEFAPRWALGISGTPSLQQQSSLSKNNTLQECLHIRSYPFWGNQYRFPKRIRSKNTMQTKKKWQDQ